MFGNTLFAEYEDLLARDKLFEAGGLSRLEGGELLGALAKAPEGPPGSDPLERAA